MSYFSAPVWQVAITLWSEWELAIASVCVESTSLYSTTQQRLFQPTKPFISPSVMQSQVSQKICLSEPLFSNHLLWSLAMSKSTSGRNRICFPLIKAQEQFPQGLHSISSLRLLTTFKCLPRTKPDSLSVMSKFWSKVWTSIHQSLEKLSIFSTCHVTLLLEI